MFLYFCIVKIIFSVIVLWDKEFKKHKPGTFDKDATGRKCWNAKMSNSSYVSVKVPLQPKKEYLSITVLNYTQTLEGCFHIHCSQKEFFFFKFI